MGVCVYRLQCMWRRNYCRLFVSLSVYLVGCLLTKNKRAGKYWYWCEVINRIVIGGMVLCTSCNRLHTIALKQGGDASIVAFRLHLFTISSLSCAIFPTQLTILSLVFTHFYPSFFNLSIHSRQSLTMALISISISWSWYTTHLGCTQSQPPWKRSQRLPWDYPHCYEQKCQKRVEEWNLGQLFLLVRWH